MDQKLVTGLKQIGFTEYEAKVYLALLVDHPATGYQVSKDSGVPRSMAYETLSRLSSKGDVLESIEGRSTFYSPVPPQVLLDRYQENQQQLLEEMRAGLDQYAAALDLERAWSLSGKQSTMAYASQMIREAQEELFLVLTDDALEKLHQDLMDADQRGISLNILLTGRAELSFGNTAQHPPAESQIQELHHTLLIVQDDRAVLVTGSDQSQLTTITNNQNLVLIARQFIWMELFAQRIASRLTPAEIEKLDPEDQRILSSHSAE